MKQDRPLTFTLILAAALARLIPHPPNLTPIGALGLFAGGRLAGWQAFAAPLLAMAMSDAILWAVLHYPPFNPFVYVSVAVSVLIGRWLCRRGSPARLAAASLIGSLQFFLITNFGAWVMLPDFYPRSLEGLLACYAAGLAFADKSGISFFGATVIGDLFFTGLLFGLHALLARSTQEEAIDMKGTAS